MRRTVFPLLGNLSKDSVPNIRVNVSKAIMAVAPYIKDNKEFMVRISLSSFSHICVCYKDLSRQILAGLSRETDFDTTFFAQKALKMF